MSDFIDITPTPRILRMLGQIDFSAEQCLCELVDNSIDAFANEVADLTLDPEITIRVPKPNNLKEDSRIEIRDNGKGMNLDQLSNSLKAGFSNNSPVDKMGLFGMGFNISTARLGGRTEIITTRKEDAHYSKVVIDFKELENSSQFQAPITQVPKKPDEMGSHGTTILISRLNGDLIKPLRRKAVIAQKLGKIYSRIIRNKKIKIFYEDQICKPFMHCVWDKSRTGKASKDTSVPAIIDIDYLIDTKRYCTSCWVWLTPKDPVCPSCNSNSTLTERERRVTGWIGVQRFFDEKEYGFDLIRNGRIIKEADKSLFDWINEDEGTTLPEYPIDGFQKMGRFVGEIELDFVQVTHQKDAFEVNSRDWKDAIKAIRGEAPIQPIVAKRMGYAPNNSPLAKLFSAFRTSKAGRDNLVPKKLGTGSAMLRDAKITELKRRFLDGEEDYVGDEKWWQLILEGEGKKPPESPGNTPDDPTGGDPFADPDTPEPSTSEPQEPEPNPEENTKSCGELSQEYILDLFKDSPIRVDAFYHEDGEHEQGFAVKARGRVIEFEYWPNSKIYSDTFLKPADFLINELAYQFFLTADAELSKTPLSWVERSIRIKYFPHLHPDYKEIDNQINRFVAELRTHLSENLPKISSFDSSRLNQEELLKIKSKMAESEYLDISRIEAAIKNGEFINYASFEMMLHIFELHPSILLDGQFFQNRIEESSEVSEIHQTYIRDAKEVLGDLLWFTNNRTPNNKPIWRARAKRIIGSLEIIAFWRA